MNGRFKSRPLNQFPNPMAMMTTSVLLLILCRNDSVLSFSTPSYLTSNLSYGSNKLGNRSTMKKRLTNLKLTFPTEVFPSSKILKGDAFTAKMKSWKEYLIYITGMDFDKYNESIDSKEQQQTLASPIASGQKQIPFLERLGRAISEEALPWIATFIIASLPSIVLRSATPMIVVTVAEFIFFLYSSAKMMFNLNVPILPEPLLRDDWESFAKLVWSSQKGLPSNRSYLMGWFYDAPFDSLREEDALTYLAWMKHGIALEHGMLSDEQLLKLKSFDLPLLQQHVNEGKPLPKRKAEEDPLPVMRFNCEPLRYRHKAILFYCFTHGADIILNQVLKRKGFTYVPATDAKNDLGYWYRLPSTLSSSSVSNPLVFAHGVGGLAFCYSLIDSLLGNSIISDDTPVILLDLPHVSLRMYDHIPQVESQVESIAKTIESVASESCARAGIEGSLKDDRTKATFVGHSYGTFLLSWMVQKRPDMVGSCVFIDPVCFSLHLKDILFNFHMQRVDERQQKDKEWKNPFDVACLKDLAGTEMHTNYSMLRQFSWIANELWPSDLEAMNIPTKVILAGNDEIVPIKAVEELFKGKTSKIGDPTTPVVQIYEDTCHGEMFMEESLLEDTANFILNFVENQKERTSFIDPISRIKKEYQELNDTVGEIWDQISYKIIKSKQMQQQQDAMLAKDVDS